MTVVLAAAVHILFCEEDVLLYKAATRGPRTDLRGARGADEIGIEATVVVHGVSEGVKDDDRIIVGGTVAATAACWAARGTTTWPGLGGDIRLEAPMIGVILGPPTHDGARPVSDRAGAGLRQKRQRFLYQPVTASTMYEMFC
ncbi:hypothetical protein ACFV60_24010 [Streptomyces virginiae]|uniref:hypothetical protein n=1 Tax=Streptomyces virginiae TaxID=1961 RepID=UPI00365C25B0